MAESRRDGELHIAAGKSRNGKSTLVSQLTAADRRLLCYDPKGDPKDWPRCQVVTSAAVLARTLRHAGQGAGRYRLFDASRDQFDDFCRIALAWAREYGPATTVVDELAQVTNPGKAPAGWHALVSTGLYLGGDIWALTQRPTECDSSSFGNAANIYCFRMTRAADRLKMAQEMDIDRTTLDRLQPYEYVHWHESGTVKTGSTTSPTDFSRQNA